MSLWRITAESRETGGIISYTLDASSAEMALTRFRAFHGSGFRVKRVISLTTLGLVP